ncbi:MAG: penicillin-binding protein 2 [Pseudohongiellaceae bacterium]
MTAGWRLYLVWLLLIAAVVLVAVKVVSLHVLQSDFLREQGDARTVRTEPLVAHRGMITDRNGEPLAISSPVKSLWLNPQEIAGRDDDIRRLAAAMELDAGELSARIAMNAEREFIYLQRRLPPARADRVLALGVPGVYARQEYQRYYPQGEVAAHLVGFSNIDDVGQEGIELAFDEWLQGIPGRKQVIKDRRGRIVRELNTIETAQPGKTLELSIDFRLQSLAYRELKEAYIHRGARSATAVVLDVESGEVLAMVNQPSFNPNNRGGLSDFGALRNRAMTDQFEPGSTIKAFTAVAALESGRYTPETIIDTSPGRIRVGRDYVSDRGRDYGELTLEQVLVKSSNVGTSRIALDIGHEPLRDVLQRVGFGEGTATGFPGEQAGTLPNHRVWHDIEVATLSFGYGLSTSALKLAQAYSVIASDGVRKPVTLLKDGGGMINSEYAQQVIDKDVTRQVKSILEAVVDPDKGGFEAASVPFYSVAGKTGTARVVGAGGYEDELHNSMFAGYAPADDPEIVVVVIINEPQGGQHYGSEVAAPVFSRIAAGAMRILGVRPDRANAADTVQLSAR